MIYFDCDCKLDHFVDFKDDSEERALEYFNRMRCQNKILYNDNNGFNTIIEYNS